MMVQMVVRAPAKVNLLLLVGPPRPDGYHELFSVMAPIGLCDELELDLAAQPEAASPTQSDGVRVTCAGVAAGENIVRRALGVLEVASRWRFSGSVTIRKRIPIAAGLGGGSSDAACVLAAAARLLATAGAPTLTQEMLRELALELGSDVPFFLAAGAALVRGRGEIVEPFDLPALHLCLLLPREELPTRAVYATYDETAGRETATEFAERGRVAEDAWRRVEAASRLGELGVAGVANAVAALMENDLELPAFRMVPDLAARRAALLAVGAKAALMSGSGPTVFGVFPSDEAAKAAAEKLADVGFAAVVASVPGAEALEGRSRFDGRNGP